jgi:hypothetical protein
MQMRVRVSLLKLTVAVGGKGSAFSVTDSRAIARVEMAVLSSTGALALAAQAALMLPHTVAKKTRHITLKAFLGELHGRLIFIGWCSATDFCQVKKLVGQNYEVV